LNRTGKSADSPTSKAGVTIMLERQAGLGLYAVYQGQQVFEALAKRMEENVELEVKLFLNISRPDRDTTASEILVSRYAQRFKDKQWPTGCIPPQFNDGIYTVGLSGAVVNDAIAGRPTMFKNGSEN
jgi:hypothetical protein